MTEQATRQRRDPESDHLLTPENAALVLIDYQPGQFDTVTSTTREDIVLNVVALARAARAYRLPVVLSTVGVELGVNEGTIPEIREHLADSEEIDRTTLNSWEDPAFRAAVEATGRKKLIMGGLWTEVCVAYPTLDAIKDGYEVYPVSDAVGGISPDAHERAMQRMIQAGAQPTTAIAAVCELQRDWGREDADKLREILRWYFPERERIGGRAGR
jgi:nicotinamidase-related amidase